MPLPSSLPYVTIPLPMFADLNAQNADDLFPSPIGETRKSDVR